MGIAAACSQGQMLRDRRCERGIDQHVFGKAAAGAHHDAIANSQVFDALLHRVHFTGSIDAGRSAFRRAMKGDRAEQIATVE